ncbi:gamma-glutamyl-gamma-aminobutyrate hydrolase family protein [Planctomycetota bacterium]
MKRICVTLWLAILITTLSCQNQKIPSAPLIGITSVYKTDEKGRAHTQVNFNYVQAVAENGGIPVVLPTIDSDPILRRYLKELDGLVLVGGADIPPSAYGEQSHETVKPLPPQRYDFERKLIAEWLAGKKPLLGVCLGMQFTNVVAGGSLIQDIPSEVGTKINHRKYHEVQIEPDSLLSQILGANEASVFSNHHQAVRNVGKDLKIIAHSADGVNEALERIDGGFGLFVQWHPEAMDDKKHRDAIYGALVRAAVMAQ